MSDQDTQEEVEIEEPISGTATKRERKQRISRYEVQAKVVDLKMRGLQASEIANTVGMSRSAVESIIQRFKPIFTELENVKDFRSIKAELLSAGQIAALKSAMSPTKIAKAGFLSTLQGFEILNKAERLESNQSTENVAHSFLGKMSVSIEDD
jgi:hypothetical protein